jgi:hypothetical protein
LAVQWIAAYLSADTRAPLKSTPLPSSPRRLATEHPFGEIA